jgi:hypothetical protein
LNRNVRQAQMCIESAARAGIFIQPCVRLIHIDSQVVGVRTRSRERLQDIGTVTVVFGYPSRGTG